MDEKKEVRWRKIGGGSLRYIRGHIIKPNEVFVACEDEIPSPFRKYVVALEDIPQTELGNTQFKREVTKQVSATNPQYEINPVGYGWFNIVNVVSGKPINEKKLRKADAEKVLKELI